MESKCADLSPSPPVISNPPTCTMPKTKVQTHTITGELLCMLFVCMLYIHIVDEMVVKNSIGYRVNITAITIHFN